jgi:hypothetical protein
MGFTNHLRSQALQGQSLVSGRGFAAVDPERQREIDLEHARALTRHAPSPALGGRPGLSGWVSPQRDPGDEGGSVRRGMR